VVVKEVDIGSRIADKCGGEVECDVSLSKKVMGFHN